MNGNLDRRSVLLLLGGAIAQGFWASANLLADENPDWSLPMVPFRIAGNLYYVGSRDLASYLVATPQGLILINSNLVSSPPQIRASVEKLGFHWGDVKVLLISHAHFDHCAGSAQILRETGAKYMVMDADVATVESGGKADFHYGRHADMQYPATRVDRVLHDGAPVRLGDVQLFARKTPGHTKGCTTWTMTVPDGNTIYTAVIVGSPNVNPGYNLINEPQYPQMAADYAKGFKTLESLPCDLFLGAHGLYFDMLAKSARLKSASNNPFVDPTGYRDYIADRERAFEMELAKQRAHPLRVHG